MTRRLSIVAIVVITACLLAAAGYGVYWWQLARGFERGVERWAAQRQSEGYEVGYDGLEVGGFPGRVVVRIAAPRIADPRRSGDWSWQGAQLTLRVAPWSPNRIFAEFSGAHRFAYAIAEGRRSVALDLGRGEAELTVSGGRVTQGESRLGDIDARLGGDIGRLYVSSASLRFRVREAAAEGPAADDRVEAEVELRDARLPQSWSRPLGTDLARLYAELTVEGRLPANVRPAAIARWRDDGGVVDVRRLDMKWGKVATAAQGSVTLDNEMRPLGSFTAELRGYTALVDALAADGLVRARDLPAIKAVLAVLSRADGNGGRVLRVPVTAQDGRLNLGPLPILSLAPLFPASARSPVR